MLNHSRGRNREMKTRYYSIRITDFQSLSLATWHWSTWANANSIVPAKDTDPTLIPLRFPTATVSGHPNTTFQIVCWVEETTSFKSFTTYFLWAAQPKRCSRFTLTIFHSKNKVWKYSSLLSHQNRCARVLPISCLCWKRPINMSTQKSLSTASWYSWWSMPFSKWIVCQIDTSLGLIMTFGEGQPKI